MSWKHLFSRSLGAAPERLHFAAHSHHLWPDASREGQVSCWDDAARLADRKWERIMGEVWPEAASEVAEELGMGRDKGDRIVFAANTHDFIVRLAAACPRRSGERLRILTTDGEFHSARRQFARWVEAGEIEMETVAVEPFDDFHKRFLAAASRGDHDLIMTSQVLFGSGRVVSDLAPICDLADSDGPWVVIDGYHSFMAFEGPFAEALSDRAFFLGGGYKYAMAGEGMGFMSCPPGYGPRPPVTGWYAEFEDLTLPPGMVGYADDAMRFMGATFDASALYRFNAIRNVLQGEGLTTKRISAHVATLQQSLTEKLEESVFSDAELLNPLDGNPHARFLAYRHPDAADWCSMLGKKGCVTDVRGSVIRLGFGLYHDEDDVAAFAALARSI